jgi:hypothetical protein
MKRIKQKKSRKYLFATPVVAIIAVVAALGVSLAVYAISRNTSVIEGSMKVASNGVVIIEDSDPGFGKKEISFKNDSETNASVLLRIAYSETWTNSSGEVVSNVGSNNANVVVKNWTNEFAQDFVDGGDGWYYYKKTLEPLNSVQVLSSISLNDTTYNKYDYDISFRFEAVQADAAAANELWGKSVTVENGVATWDF